MSSLARGWLGAGAAIAWLAAPHRARAEEAREPSGFDLVWSAPAGCPSQSEVENDVTRLHEANEALATLHVVARVARTREGAWSVEIEMRSDAGTASRSIEGESCRAVADATALFLALAFAPPAIETPAPPPAPAPAASQPESALAVPAPASREPDHAEHGEAAASTPIRASSTWARFSFGLFSSLDSATLPRPALGIEAVVAWRPRPLRVEASVTVWGAQSVDLLDSPAVFGRFSMVSGALRLCYERAFGSFDVGPCAAAAVDDVRSEGFGDLASARGGSTWLSGELGAASAWRFSRWGAVRLRIDGNAPFSRPRFVIEGSDAVHRPAIVSARASLGLELTIL